MPNRIIKESLRHSRSLAAVSPEAERLFWRLIVSADDFGCYEGSADIILGTCFPVMLKSVTEDQIEAWLQELTDAEMLTRYSVEGKTYLHLTNWARHQQTRSHKPKYPAPPDLRGSVSLHPDERDVEGALWAALSRTDAFNGESIISKDRQLRIGEKYLDIVVRTDSSTYVLELKRGRLTEKGANQLRGYLELVDGRGVLIGSGISGTLDAAACVDDGIALVTYDDNLNWTVAEAAGFLSNLPLIKNVIQRDSTLDHVGANVPVFGIGNENGNGIDKRGKSDSLGEKRQRERSTHVQPVAERSGDDPVDKPPKVEYPDDFERFWRAYPRRVGKQDAYGLWQRWVGGKIVVGGVRYRASPDDLVSAAVNYAKAKIGRTDLDKLKHPRTFLSERGQHWVEWIKGPPEGERPSPAGHGRWGRDPVPPSHRLITGGD